MYPMSKDEMNYERLIKIFVSLQAYIRAGKAGRTSGVFIQC